MGDEITIKPSGRMKVRITSDGLTLCYTYADEDPQRIPEGMRRVTFLEPDPYYAKGQDDE